MFFFEPQVSAYFTKENSHFDALVEGEMRLRSSEIVLIIACIILIKTYGSAIEYLHNVP